MSRAFLFLATLLISLTLAASQNKGNSNENDTTDTSVSAGNGAVLVSGQDTTLKGAQVSAKQIVADVGGNIDLKPGRLSVPKSHPRWPQPVHMAC